MLLMVFKICIIGGDITGEKIRKGSTGSNLVGAESLARASMPSRSYQAHSVLNENHSYFLKRKKLKSAPPTPFRRRPVRSKAISVWKILINNARRIVLPNDKKL